MLSYRHGFHAGNHGDVLKHLCQMLILEKLKTKDKPFVYIDTHSGAGYYDLTAEESVKTNEFQQGINLLSDYQGDNTSISAYYRLTEGYLSIQQYPGSPEIAHQVLREQDKLILMEYHNNEILHLRRNMRNSGASIHHRDGFEGLVAVAPPKLKRGMVLIDPPYELAEEYSNVISAVDQTIQRWKNAIVMIWYPLLGARAGKKQGLSEKMLQQLADIPAGNMLCAELRVDSSQGDAGMYGSGVAILNAPWQLDNQLENCLPELCRLLSQSNAGSHSLTWLRQE